MPDGTLGTCTACHLNEYADALSTANVGQIWPCNLDMHEASHVNGFAGAAKGVL